MKKITELLGKPVLSLYESITQGIVKDVLFDKNFKKLKYLVLFEDNEFQEEKILLASDIYTTGKDAIIIKNNEAINNKTILLDEKTNPINNNCYNTSGTFLGNVGDIILDDKDNIISVSLNNNEQIDIKNIITCGKDAMFVQDKEKLVKLAFFKTKEIENNSQNSNIKVKILRDDKQEQTKDDIIQKQNQTDISEQKNNENINSKNSKITNNENALSTTENELKIEPIKPKKKVILDTLNLPTSQTTKNNFLIGRKVMQNIYSFNHELIIRKNTRITEKTILLAKSHSKLKELTLYSK